jgi:beta-aspartyl-peptidase (threonine type)
VSRAHSWASGEVDGYGILVHGGAGSPGAPEAGCRDAAELGAEVLRRGGSALDAVQRAVEALEDDPRYNAGTGAALNAAGRLELDAAIMDGSGLRAGAVCCLGTFHNPIAIARAVLEEGDHVLYAARGADAFAHRAGFVPVAEDATITEAARRRLADALGREGPSSYGDTVGAVARDAAGTVAVAASTGGIAGKRPGRVGDTPIIGAGVYADDEGGAVAATGPGEGILRVGLALMTVDALRSGVDPELAAREAIEALYERLGVLAGVILIDPRGRMALARSTPAMPWAAFSAAGLSSGS